MSSKLNPYLHFDGKAKEAMEFYKSALGGELTMTTYAQGGMSQDPTDAERIMHAQLVVENGITLMASDTGHGWTYTHGTHMSVSLSGSDEAELKGYWDKLSEGSNIEQPLVAAPWGDQFGMFTDKFGVRWMVNIAGKKA